MSDSVSGVSRSGRVRKKSAKLMEMEDFDSPDLESEFDVRGRKKHKVDSLKHSDGPLSPVVLQGLPASGYISDHPGLSAKLKEIKHPKKSKTKLDSPVKILSPLKINVGEIPRIRASEEGEGSDSSLRLKLILSPKDKGSSGETEYSSSELSPIKKEEKKKKKKTPKPHHDSGINTLALLAAGGLLSSSIDPVVKIKSKTKKKSSKDHIKQLSFSAACIDESPDVDIGMDELGHSSELVIAEPKPAKKKKSSSKKNSGDSKVKVKLETSEQIPEFSVQLCEDDEDVESIALPASLVPHSRSVYLLEKKKGKKKKSGTLEPKKDKKKGRPMTAYMLWCREHRQSIVAENPEMDFATISRRLGEAWQSLTDKQKQIWRRKAKKLAAKTAHVINTGKAEHSGTKLLNKQHKHQATDSDSSPNPRDMYKVVGTSPIDVAAHLKLLGESLSIIGQRLTEHEGQIAVSGSLSVLLDSTLCALGPLLCLSAEIPEVNGCRPEILGGILDNIAYIMPGL